MLRQRTDGCARPRRAFSSGLTVLGVASLLAACSSSSTTKTTTTSTLPPLPPNVIAYVALAGSGGNVGNGSSLVEVTVAPSTSVGKTIRVGLYPDAVAVTPDGHLALVANYSSNTVTPISLPSNKALAPIPAGPGPAGIAVLGNGRTAYVTDANSDTVTPINLATLKPEHRIVVGDGPQGIAVTPNGARAYVADAGAIIAGQSGSIGHEVTPIDLSTGRALAPITVGNAPLGVAVSPGGGTVFVTNLNSESVSPIDVATDKAGAPIATDGGPLAIAVAGSTAWVVNAPAGDIGNNIQPISLATDAAGTPIHLPKEPQALAIAPGGTTAWVACLSNRIVEINLRTRHRSASIPVKGGPFAIALAVEAKAGGSPTAGSTAHKKKAKTKKS
jgi:YVTN family beta-propeller protein